MRASTIDREYLEVKAKKFIGKISNGFDYWFTFILNPGVETTNNRAERALRPHVVLRKILGTLRNGKGTAIHELIMTMLATWGQRGLNCLQNANHETSQLNTYFIFRPKTANWCWISYNYERVKILTEFIMETIDLMLIIILYSQQQTFYIVSM